METAGSATGTERKNAMNINPKWGAWATPPKPFAKEDFAETYQTEVLVIGAGISGLSCACSAAESGCKVTVIEKLGSYHGYAASVGVVNSSYMREQGYENDPDELIREWLKRSANRCDERLVHLFAYNCAEAMDWAMEMAGKPEYGGYNVSILQAAYRGESYKEIPCAHVFTRKPENGGKRGLFGVTVLMEPMYQECLKRDTQFLFNTTMLQLIKEDGRVVGAAAQTADGKLIAVYASKGVLVSTGGIEWNDEMCEDLCPVANKTAAKVNAPKGMSVGEGHRAALWAGAAFEDAPFPIMSHPQAYDHPTYCFLFVTPKGKRYMNEDNYLQARSLGIIRTGYEWCWSIFDSDLTEKVKATLPYGGGLFWNEGSNPEMSRIHLEAGLRTGNTVQADTPRELAEKMGIDPDAFEETFNNYNAFCEKGHDDEFGKRKEMLIPLDKPPYYGRKIGAATLCVVGGVKVDEQFRALDEHNEPVPGLYVLGNTMAGRYGVDYPFIMPGNSTGSGMTYGYLLGRAFGNPEFKPR